MIPTPTNKGTAQAAPGPSGNTMVIVLVVILAGLLVLVVVAALLKLRPTPKEVEGPTSAPAVPPRTSSVTTPQLTETYENPFEKKTQYANPFAEFKSPFQNLQ